MLFTKFEGDMLNCFRKLVAYLTGFSSASYFATSFLKQFNISPSNFVKSIRNDNTEV